MQWLVLHIYARNQAASSPSREPLGERVAVKLIPDIRPSSSRRSEQATSICCRMVGSEGTGTCCKRTWPHKLQVSATRLFVSRARSIPEMLSGSLNLTSGVHRAQAACTNLAPDARLPSSPDVAGGLMLPQCVTCMPETAAVLMLHIASGKRPGACLLTIRPATERAPLIKAGMLVLSPQGKWTLAPPTLNVTLRTWRTSPPVQGHKAQLPAEGLRPAEHASHSHVPAGTPLRP